MVGNTQCATDAGGHIFKILHINNKGIKEKNSKVLVFAFHYGKNLYSPKLRVLSMAVGIYKVVAS